MIILYLVWHIADPWKNRCQLRSVSWSSRSEDRDRRERDKNPEEPSQSSLHLSPARMQRNAPHALNNEPPNVTVTLQKQMTALRAPLAREKSVTEVLWRHINKNFEGRLNQLHRGWLPLYFIYGHSITIISVGYWLRVAGSHLLPAAKTILICTDIPVSQSDVNNHKAEVLLGQSS